jgi:hypothetical protein
MIAYLRNNIIEVLEVVTLKVYMWREKTEYCYMLYNRPGKVTSCSASSVDMQSWYRSMVFIPSFILFRCERDGMGDSELSEQSESNSKVRGR